MSALRVARLSRLFLVLIPSLLLPILPAQMGSGTAEGKGAPAPLPEDRRTGAATIKEEQLKDWLTFLTSNECAGRGTGSEGFRVAAEFVRDHFKSLGLEPAG